ncbi:hypothetical protein GBA52_025983 [Prunus armeniaca]|nr:hypothetical protein GBA52_025983 [Prunus armeniaca]
MPLLHSRVTKTTYNNLVDKVHVRLASWKSRVICFASRATLIQAVTSAIPVFAMQTAKRPTSICDELDKLNRNFFGGGSDKKTKVHLCRWDLLCKPKSKRGLGFKKCHDMNKALLAKTSWRLLKKDEGLWAQIFEKKYLRGHSPCDPNLLLKQNCSPTWKGIVFGSQLLEKGIIWRLGKRTILIYGRISGLTMKLLSRWWRDCTIAKRVWNLFLNTNQDVPFFHAELHPWLLSNFFSKNEFLQIPWKTLFGVICWHLWKWRNDFIFKNKDDLPFNPRELIVSATKEWIKASTNNQLGGDKIQVSLPWTALKWCVKAKRGWIPHEKFGVHWSWRSY